jgi:hypothetical protein
MVGDRRGVDGYKNGELVFRGFGAWSSRGDCEIVCVGGHQEIEPDFRRHAPRVPVRRLSLSDSELRLAYAGAIALAYPSRYEGFGLPIAEAMACGCPVITTTASSVPEVAGEAAVYVDPDDPQEFARALDAIRDPARRSALVEAGLKRAERFSWEPAAEAYASLFDRAARKDDADEREARGAVWQARREAQSREQAVRRSRRRAVAPTLATARAESTTSRRLKNLALRHLPPWAIQRLRRVHAARSSGALSARRLLARTFLRQ